MFGPARDPVFYIARIDPGAAQSRCRFLARLMAMLAIDSDRAAGRQLLTPALNRLGITPDRANDHTVVGSKGSVAANIDHDRRRGRTNRTVQV